MGGLPALAFPLGKLQVEGASVGARTLVITVDDSILTPDLAKLKIEGYEIEHAVFVDEKPEFPVRYNPHYIDMTAPGNGRILEYLPSAGVVVLDWPAGYIPHSGTVLGDTAFGGLLRRVVKVEGASEPGLVGRKWTLTTVEAELTDAIHSGELSFSTRLDLNQAVADMDRVEEVVGYLPDGSANYADAEYNLRAAQVLFQPTVTGRIRVAGGQVEDLSFQVAGRCEVMADARGAFHGRGEFQFEEELPSRAPMVVPLGGGLFIRVQSRPSFRMEASAEGEGFSAHADFRVGNAIRGELAYARGQWRPMAENKMTHSSRSVKELWGEGRMKLSLKPRMDFLLGGVQGPAFTFEPYALFSSTQDAKAWTYRAGGPEDPPRDPRDPRGTQGEAAVLGQGSKQLSLGSNIFMETRTTFTGPALTRNFLLFSREQTVLSPPREGSLSLKEADSNRVLLVPETFPKADRYVIQHRIGNGPWESLSEHPALARIRLAGLKPSTQYRFRAIGVNAMGAGPAFPPEGIAYTTPALNHPPFAPLAQFPDSGAVLPEGNPLLAWRGGDPDPGSRVQYTVYLDTRMPPVALRAAGVTDTSLALTGLKPGTTYYWKVAAFDGKEVTEGPVRSFTVRAPPPVPAAPAAKAPVRHPMVALPRGSFLRADGREIVVGPFQIGKYEVTQAEYQRVTGRNPSYRLQDSLPVERVTWDEAESFCREMGGRLPTEAEWEYAARAGSATEFYWGSGNAADYAWFRENSEDRTQKVGLKKPNGWGLHDMAGNVFEWVQDWYAEYPSGAVDHPRGPESGTAKVIRGASWYSESANLGLASRYNNRPAFRNFKVGFRCAKDAEPSSSSLPSTHSLAGKLEAALAPVSSASGAPPAAPVPATAVPAAPSTVEPAVPPAPGPVPPAGGALRR